jgi:hypothetical protein
MANSAQDQEGNHGATNEEADFPQEFLDCFDSVAIQLRNNAERTVPSFAKLTEASGPANSQRNSAFFFGLHSPGRETPSHSKFP